jgi:hypothetical protein
MIVATKGDDEMSAEKLSSYMRIRMDSELRKQFEKVHAASGNVTSQSATLRELIKAACRYYDKHGHLYPPWDLSRSEIAGGETQSTVVAPVIN